MDISKLLVTSSLGKLEEVLKDLDKGVEHIDALRAEIRQVIERTKKRARQNGQATSNPAVSRNGSLFPEILPGSSKKDIVATFLARRTGPRKFTVNSTWAEFDKEMSGVLTRSEFQKAFHRLGREPKSNLKLDEAKPSNIPNIYRWEEPKKH
jgi:hypothetical protein